MPLILLILALVVFALVLWAIFKYIPMEPDVKQIVKIVAVLGLILWLLQIFGVFELLKTITVPKF